MCLFPLFSLFVSQDNLACEAELSDNNILSLITNPATDNAIEDALDDECDPSPPQPISVNQAMSAVHTLQQFFEENEFPIQHVQYLRERMDEIYNIQNKHKKQTCITHYFH
jgi:DNA repair ATPase RecN